MKARTKSALLLFATLLVGILIGTFGNSTLHAKRMEQIRSTFDRRGGFIELAEEMIQPDNDVQRTRIRAVLEKTEARFKEDRRVCRTHFAATSDSLRADLAQILTPAQQTRLDEWLSRGRGGRGGNGSDRRGERRPRGDRPR